VDPIHPITPGPSAISRTERPPVQRAERISRERDRPAKDAPERKRREPARQQEPQDGEDGERPHIDIRV